MVKSSTGTDEAICPMWFRFSSVRPVEGQLMDLGCPSRVKKPGDNMKKKKKKKRDVHKKQENKDKGQQIMSALRD